MLKKTSNPSRSRKTRKADAVQSIEETFAVLHTHCAALDVHKETIMACVLIPGNGDQPRSEVRQLGTTTGELEALAQWLLACGVTHGAMESTGVYWKPVFNILEPVCELILVNARQVKQVPGRKTGVANSVWGAKLLRYGLLNASFVPPLEVRHLRDLCRMRTTQVSNVCRCGKQCGWATASVKCVWCVWPEVIFKSGYKPSMRRLARAKRNLQVRRIMLPEPPEPKESR